MGKAIQRVGDLDDGGGAILSSLQNKVTIGGIYVSVDGSPVSDHGAHTSVVTSGGNPLITINKIPVNFTDDIDSCGHIRIGGYSEITG